MGSAIVWQAIDGKVREPGLHPVPAADSVRILARFELPYNNATLEMINNEIKTMEREATGYRDQKFFELQIPAMSGKSYAIVVWTLFSPPPSCAYMRARNIVMCLHILPVLSLSKSFRYVLL